jgi:hypothetical protein
MYLPGAGYPKEILNKSYQDWTPEEAELVRRHFLGPLLHDRRFSEMPLGAIASQIWGLRNLVDEDEEKLMYMAQNYSEYSKRVNNSFTRSPGHQKIVDWMKAAEAEAAVENSPATSAPIQDS